MVFVLVIITFLIINRWAIGSKITQRIQSSLSAVASSIGKLYENTFTTKDDLRREVERYKQLSAELTVNQSYIDQLEHDVEELQVLIDYQNTLSYTMLHARILARSIEGENTILIDQGSEEGVRPGLAVVIENGHMIGYTKNIRAHTSIVVLLDDPSSKIPVAILGETKTIGLVEGQGGFLLHMGFIPHSEEIEKNDVVVTSGLDGSFPSGLVIGVVNEVIQEETASFQEALIEPLFDVRFYRNVLVLDPLKETYAE